MDAQLKETQRALAQNKQDHVKQVVQLQHSLKHEAERSSQLEAQAAELQEVSASKAAAQHAADSFSQQLKKLRQQLLKAEQDTCQAELTSHNIQTDLDQTSATLKRLEASKAVMQEALDQNREKLLESQSEVQAQQRLLQEAAVREETSQAKASQLDIALLAAQGKHAASREAAEKLSMSISADKVTLQADTSKLQSHFDSITTDLKTANAKLIEQQERCSNLQQALDAKSSTLNATQDALAAKNGEIHVLVAAVDKLEIEVHSQRTLQAEQDERFAAASACLTDLKDDFQSLQISAEADSSEHAANFDGQQVKPSAYFVKISPKHHANFNMSIYDC